MSNDSVLKRLKDFIDNEGVKKSHVAKKIDTHLSYLSQAIHGKRELPDEVLKRLHHYLQSKGY